jgi:hypothetical protein
VTADGNRERARSGVCTSANTPYLVKMIRDALEQHAIPRPEKPGCTICAGALAALNQLVPEEADRGR